MIYYIASYPRSGNSWIISLIANNFSRITTDIHSRQPDANAFNRLAGNIKKLYNIDLKLPIGIPRKRPELGELAEKLFLYETTRHSEIFRYTGLIGGCQNLLTEENRSRLAADKDFFFLKTHLPPYDSYFPGEYVIQIIRNPGACFWSYYNFLKDVIHTHKSLTDIVNGNVGFGSWSDYHESWFQFVEKLGDHYLRLNYEKIVGAELSCCRNLSKFMNIPMLSEDIKPFDHYHEILPHLMRQGKATGWEQYYSKDQLNLLWQKHGGMMTLLGYATPDHRLGQDIATY